MKFQAWAGQVTTGIGALIACPTAIAFLSGQITWQQAIPPMVAAVIGLIYPENKALGTSAQTVAADVEVLIPQLLTAYRTGLAHGAAATPTAPKPISAS
jgi:hypothetical protein